MLTGSIAQRLMGGMRFGGAEDDSTIASNDNTLSTGAGTNFVAMDPIAESQSIEVSENEPIVPPSNYHV